MSNRLLPFGISSTTGTLTSQSQIENLLDSLAYVRITRTGLPITMPTYASLLGTHNATIELNGVSQYTGVRISIANIMAVTVPATIPLSNGVQEVSYTITQAMVDQLTSDGEDTVDIVISVVGATGTIQAFNGLVNIDSTVSGRFDETAIHDDVSGEINAITQKTSVVDDDILLIEDSEDSFNKKRVLASAIGTGGGTTPTAQEFIRVRPDTAQALASTGDTEITFVTVDENTNTARFTVTSGNVNVLQASRYLLNVKTSIEVNNTSGSQRVDSRTRIRVNGTKLAPVTYGHYARNSQVSPSVMHSSDTLTFMADLSANDIVDVVLETGDLTPVSDTSTVIDGTYLEIIEMVGVQGIRGEQGEPGVDGGIDSWASLTGTITNAQITSTLLGLNFFGGAEVEVFKATSLTSGLEDAVTLPENYNTFRTLEVVQFSSSEVRIQEFPIRLITDSDITSTTLLRVAGDTDITFNSSTRVVSDGASASNIYAIYLKH